ncbi:MAG: hypothetical protein AAB582_00010 [Patescibacteria group bacterium]
MTDKKIGLGVAFLMVAVSLIIEGAQILLTFLGIGIIATPVLTVFAWTLFFIWFAMLGVSYFDKDGALRLLTALSSVAVELVPIINAVPALTLGVAALIFQHNRKVEKEERRRNRPSQPRVANDNRRREATDAA